MSLDDIKKKIISDAESKKSEAVGVARQQADEILAQNSAEVASYVAEYERNVSSIAGNLERGLIIDARRTLANSILAKKRNRIDQVYDKAKEDFVKSADYAKVLKTLVVKAIHSKKETVIVGENEKVLNQAWLETVNKEASADLSFAKNQASFKGGVIIQDGNTFVNITADTLFSLIRENTEKPVADILFGG